MKKTFFVFLLSTSAVLFSQESIQFEKDNFAKILEKAKKQNKLIFLDAYASWCGPCKMIGPVIEELAGEYDGKAVIAKINVDDAGDLASEYGVMSIPTLIYFKGGKEVKRLVGSRPKSVLVRELEALK